MNEFEPVEPADLAAKPAPKELTKGQRRVLGVLVEKAITTPDQYPLTLKALTAGCNQKSNRDPITNYNEETVEQYLDELRGLGLVACVHTESGRTERFRHYVRKRYPFNEAQLDGSSRVNCGPARAAWRRSTRRSNSARNWRR
jgi:hypothetical protein